MPRFKNPALTRTHRVKTALLRRIRSGEIRPGACIPSEPHLVETMGICRNTVRRAVAELVREGFLETRPGVGHVVKSCAGRPTVGVALGSRADAPGGGPVWLRLLTAVWNRLETGRYDVRFYVLRGSGLPFYHSEKDLIRDVERGVLCATIGLGSSVPPLRHGTQARNDHRLADAMTRRRIPSTAFCSYDLPGTVGLDQHTTAYHATTFLLERGVRNVALFGAMRGSEAIDDFVGGYRTALRDHGVSFSEHSIHWIKTSAEAEGYQGMRSWWPGVRRRSHQDRVGVIVPDDVVAKGLMYGATTMGVRIPRDLTLVALAIRDSPLFMPFPYFRMVFDPDEVASHLVKRTCRMLVRPDDVPARLMLTLPIEADLQDASGNGRPGKFTPLLSGARITNFGYEEILLRPLWGR